MKRWGEDNKTDTRTQINRERESEGEREWERERRGYPASASLPDTVPHSHLTSTLCRTGNNFNYFLEIENKKIILTRAPWDSAAPLNTTPKCFYLTLWSSAERKTEELPKPPTRSSDGDFTHGIWRLFELTLVSSPKLLITAPPRQPSSSPRNTQRMTKKWLQVREVLLHQCGQRRDREPAGASSGLLVFFFFFFFNKSVRTSLICASQQTAMTAADSGATSVCKPEVGPWLDSVDPTWPAKTHPRKTFVLKTLCIRGKKQTNTTEIFHKLINAYLIRHQGIKQGYNKIIGK